jgi:competence protein ComEA
MALSKPQRIALLLVLLAILGVSLYTLSRRAVVPGSHDRLALTPAPDRPRPILIDVRGAVNYPGLYWVLEGTRVQEVLGRAGVNGEADTTSLSMAALVHDGDRVFVPTRPPPGTWQPPAGVNTASVQPVPVRPVEPAHVRSVSPRGRGRQAAQPSFTSPINLNTASAEAIAALPKIGPTKAQRIVDYRTVHGPFHTFQDLDAVPGIGPETIRVISPYVCF